MPYSRILIVANPTSGRGRARRTADILASKLVKAGCKVEVCFTTAPGEGGVLTRAACGQPSPPECVVACGGDGTVQEVAGELATLRATVGEGNGAVGGPLLGLAPAGRCNDFARALGLSPQPDAIVKTLLGGSPRPVDLGWINGRFFCTVATLGIDSAVSGFVDQMRMPLRGTAAYIYGALRTLPRYRPRLLRLEGDFGVIERPLLVASTANTSFYGGNIRIAPRADPADGLLDLCLIDPVPLLRAVSLIPKLLAGKHESLPFVSFLRTRWVHISAPGHEEAWADGERVAVTPAEIHAAPSALRVVTPNG